MEPPTSGEPLAGLRRCPERGLACQDVDDKADTKGILKKKNAAKAAKLASVQCFPNQSEAYAARRRTPGCPREEKPHAVGYREGETKESERQGAREVFVTDGGHELCRRWLRRAGSSRSPVLTRRIHAALTIAAAH